MRQTRAERRAQTRDDLVDAADRLFSGQGFHLTSLDAVADAAGYTKGAVYSNFASKEDLFFAVYERRADRARAEAERAFAQAPDEPDAARSILAAAARRRGGPEDGWLAVFFEFWTHVLRHPEHRERFAAIHARVIEPFAAAMERYAARHGIELPLGARPLAIALYAMSVGLSLERLTQPGVVDAELNVRVHDLFFGQLTATRGGAPDGAEV